ncbi:MAG: hypothetical protein ACRDPE_23435 [Solirubrobacterales bacterium]
MSEQSVSLPAKVAAAVKSITSSEMKVPATIDARIRRGKAAMAEGAPKRNECLHFAKGEQYKWIDSKNVLRDQSTVSSYELRGGKARHRVRTVRNYIFDVVESEVAAATQKVPGYEITPTSNDPKRISAARLSRKVCNYGYEQWNIRKSVERVIRYSVVADEGFAWPYFDSNVGPYFQVPLEDENGPTGEYKTVGQGEIKVRVYGPNEVFWEPGLTFDESRWHGIVQARDMDEVMECDGYVGGALVPDGQQAETSDPDTTQERLVLVTEYLERPTRNSPNGRWLTMANGRIIVPERPYPCMDGEGKILDEPVLLELHYSEDPDSDRNSGIVRHLVDPQRQLNHAVSKIAEWVALMLNPQMIVQNGTVLSGKLNDVPGAIIRTAGGEVTVKPVPPIPVELFRQKEEAILDIQRIAAQNDIPSGVESGSAIQYLLEKDASRRAGFYNNLAQFHSRLARHCLYLVQRHYTEPRLLKVKGAEGIEVISDFLGAQLLGEMDVRVQAGSLEPRTLANIEVKIMGYAERGWIAPHEAMAAINAGTAEELDASYEKDIARANLIIQKVREGPEVLFATPARRPFFGEDPGTEEVVNEATGEVEQVQREQIPGWMPRPFDNIPVQKDVIADWMKGTEYDELSPPQQEALNTVYDAFLQIEAKHQAEEARAQSESAEAQGMHNAAKPQVAKPLPSQAPIGGEA